MSDIKDNFYVRRDEWIDQNGKLHERINKVDNKHTGLHNDLKLIVTQLNSNTEQLIKSQDKTNGHLEKMNNNLIGFNGRIQQVEYDQKDAREDIDAIKISMTEKQRANATVMVAIVGAIGTIAVAAIEFAKIFF